MQFHLLTIIFQWSLVETNSVMRPPQEKFLFLSYLTKLKIIMVILRSDFCP